jgi:hypothetical protein
MRNLGGFASSLSFDAADIPCCTRGRIPSPFHFWIPILSYYWRTAEVKCQCSQFKKLIENKTEFVKKALDMLQRPWGRRPVCDRMGANRTAANEDFLILVSGHVPFFAHYRFRRLSSFS